jgi:hypothetical protein
MATLQYHIGIAIKIVCSLAILLSTLMLPLKTLHDMVWNIDFVNEHVTDCVTYANENGYYDKLCYLIKDTSTLVIIQDSFVYTGIMALMPLIFWRQEQCIKIFSGIACLMFMAFTISGIVYLSYIMWYVEYVFLIANTIEFKCEAINLGLIGLHLIVVIVYAIYVMVNRKKKIEPLLYDHV